MQFSAWNKSSQGGNNLVRKYGPGDAIYDRIGSVVDQVFDDNPQTMPDPTDGAVYYYAPQGMPGGKAPRWWNAAVNERGGSKTIGHHRFAGKVNGSPEALDRYSREYNAQASSSAAPVPVPVDTELQRLGQTGAPLAFVDSLFSPTPMGQQGTGSAAIGTPGSPGAPVPTELQLFNPDIFATGRPVGPTVPVPPQRPTEQGFAEGAIADVPDLAGAIADELITGGIASAQGQGGISPPVLGRSPVPMLATDQAVAPSAPQPYQVRQFGQSRAPDPRLAQFLGAMG